MTKRRAIEKKIAQVARTKGWTPQITEGARHTKFVLGKHTIILPRHREIKEGLGRALLRDLDRIEKEN